MTEIKIPLRLVSEANSNEHWSKKSKRHKIQKMLVRSYLNTKLYPDLPFTVTLTRGSPRPFDCDDNLPMSFKYIKDEIADFFIGEYYSKSGLRMHGRTDDNKMIDWKYAQEKTSNKEYYIKISVEPHKQDLT